MKRYEALARHPLAIAGALITTASAVVFIALLIAQFAGLFDNPYAGLVVFIALPAIFVIGLLMIPAGMWLEQRRLLRDPTTPTDWPVIDLNARRVRGTVLLFTALTAVNIVIILVAGYGSLHWMDSPQFCGQVCHEPMNPQFTAWRDGPHSRIACAECHIAEGAQGFVSAKLAGTRQLVHVVTGNVPKPIPPGAHLPSVAQTQACEGCHRPSRTGADRIRVIREYADDEGNTETVTVLQMFMGGPTSGGHSIHWHADPANQIEYVATGSDRQTIIYIKATNARGEVKEYRAADVTDQAINGGVRRTMNCADCHNTVGHPISPTAERMVDRAIATGEVSQKLPFARREGVRLVSASYTSQEEAANAIDRGIRDFYAKQSGADAQAVSRASAALQDVYRRNVFPAMKVTWGSYPENRVHVASPGCVRCHDDEHKAKDGSAISGDCEYCHKEIQQPQ